MTTAQQPKPLRLSKALIYFLLAALTFWLGIYFVIPQFISNKYSVSLSFSFGLLLPLLLLLIAAVIMCRKEQTRPGWNGLRERWRLAPMKLKEWGWTIILLGITLAGYFSLEGTTDWVVTKFPFIQPPAEFGLLRTEDSFFGMPLKGNWWVLVAHFFILLLNVLGEELFFRGILFPRQQAAHGKNTWWIHGLCYHAFHMFYPWDVLRILPESLAYGLVAQKTRNTWPGIISHFAFNGLGLIATANSIMQ